MKIIKKMRPLTPKEIDIILDGIIADRYEGTVLEAYKAIIKEITRLRKLLSKGVPV